MRQALCICRKELNVYFASPIAYIVIAIFLLVTGWFFFPPSSCSTRPACAASSGCCPWSLPSWCRPSPCASSQRS